MISERHTTNTAMPNCKVKSPILFEFCYKEQKYVKPVVNLYSTQNEEFILDKSSEKVSSNTIKTIMSPILMAFGK